MPARKLLLLGGLCLLFFCFGAGCKSEKGLRIHKIEPNSGPDTGGSQVVIYGSGFQADGALGVKVYFGERLGRSPHFEGDDKLIVEPPPGELNKTVDVKLLFDDGRTKVIEKAYTYTNPAAGFGVDELTEGTKGKGGGKAGGKKGE